MTDLLRLDKVSKFYATGDTIGVGMRNVSLSLNIGEFVAVTGESGSGKTTLLNVLSGMDSYEEGEFYINGEETSGYIQSDWERYRNESISFIFQDYNIIDSYTVLENVECALMHKIHDKIERRNKALELLDKVGLSTLTQKKGMKLSGGQKQRVVIARALAKDAPIVMADEPTGNLDTASAEQIIKLLAEISKDKLVVIVTHNYDEVKNYATRKLTMYDNSLIDDTQLKPTQTTEYKPKEEEQSVLQKKDLLKLSTLNVFSSPKRFVFLFALFLAVNILVVYCLGLFMSSVNFKGVPYGVLFENYSKNRYIIKNTDGTKFTEEQEKLLSMLTTDSVNYLDVGLDRQWYIQTRLGKSLECYPTPLSMYSGPCMVGRMPENDKEVFLMINKSDEDTVKLIMKDDNYTIMRTLAICSGPQLTSVTTKVVGYSIYNNLSNIRKNTIVYTSDNLYKEISLMTFVISQPAIVTIQEGFYKGYKMEIPIMESPTDSFGIYNIEADTSFRPFNEALLKCKISMTPTGNAIEREAYLTCYGSSGISASNLTEREQKAPFILAVPRAVLKEMANSHCQASISINSFTKGLSLSMLKGKGLEAMPSVSYKLLSNSDLIFMLIFIAVFVVVIFILYALMYRISKLMVMNRKREYNILRSLGYGISQIKKMITAELLIVGLIGYFASIIAYAISMLSNWQVVNVVYSIGIWGFVATLIVLIYEIYVISDKYTYLMFKDSLKTQLRRD